MTADAHPAIASTPQLHRHERVVAFVDLRTRERASTWYLSPSPRSYLVSVDNKIVIFRNSEHEAAPVRATPSELRTAAFERHDGAGCFQAWGGSNTFLVIEKALCGSRELCCVGGRRTRKQIERMFSGAAKARIVDEV